jgi:hypothetical protein
MDDGTVWVAVAGQVATAVSAWAGSRKGVDTLSAKVTGLTERVGRLEVVVGLRGALRGKDTPPPAPSVVAALIEAEGGPRHVDEEVTPVDRMPPSRRK